MISMDARRRSLSLRRVANNDQEESTLNRAAALAGDLDGRQAQVLELEEERGPGKVEAQLDLQDRETGR